MALAAAFETIDAVEGRIDVLVNNAGLQRVGRTEAFDPETWRLVVDVHLGGMFHCTALAIPRLRRQGGAIVSLSSAAGIVGLPGRGPYSAAKGAIAAFTRELAVELAPDGIRVNAIAPGVTLTPLVQQGLDDGSIHDDFVTEIPMRRFGTPDEIAHAIRFLASDEASYITGRHARRRRRLDDPGHAEPASRLGDRLTHDLGDRLGQGQQPCVPTSLSATLSLPIVTWFEQGPRRRLACSRRWRILAVTSSERRLWRR